MKTERIIFALTVALVAASLLPACVSKKPASRSLTCGIPSTSTTASCFSPDGISVHMDNAPAGKEYCCPKQWNGALLFPIGTVGVCTRGAYSTANQKFGFLEVGGQVSRTSYGCQPNIGRSTN